MKKYSKLFAFILAVAIVLPGFAQAILVETTSNGIEVHRLGGVDRVGTSVLASKTAYPNATDAVVLAGFNGEADALTGTLLAAAKDAPLLITRQEELTKEAQDEIVRLKAKTVYILGGEAAVSMAVDTTLKGLGKTVVRVSGDNRDETAAKIAKEVKATNADSVFLALGRPAKEGDALADALAIGPVSAMKNMPVLLTERNNIPAATVTAMKNLNVKNVTIIGGTTAITAEVASTLETLGYKVNRIGESSREETALKIAETYFTNPKNLIVAYGRKSADALVGGYLGAKMNAPILLTDDAGLNDSTAGYISANATTTYVLGGEIVITKAVVKQIVEALEDKNQDKEDELNLQEAIKAVEEYENKLATKDQILELVNNDDLRNEVSASKTSAFNKVQLVKGEEKDALLARLDVAHDKLIAATAVKGLQNAAKNLTAENLGTAKIKLSNAKTNVKRIADGDIKTALNALIKIEEDKIIAYDKKLETNIATVESVNALIVALPEASNLNVGNWEEYLDQIVDTRAAYESLTAEQQAKLKPENQVKYDEVMARAEIVEEEYILGLDD